MKQLNIVMKLFGVVRYVTSKKWVDFGDDLSYVNIGLGLGLQLTWQRFAFSVCSL